VKGKTGKNKSENGKPVNDTRNQLAAEIIEIVEQLDEEGLETLLGAAKAVVTKRKIEIFNRELNLVAGKAAKRRQEASRPEYRVSIERTQDDFFVIQMDQARIFFNIQEMREITGICHSAAGSRAADPRSAGAKRLYKWFEKERSDLLADAGIDSERSLYLSELYDLVISTYKLKS